MRRPRSVGEAQGWRTVDRLARKFEYPDERTFPTAPAFGGGGGAPTVVVAAADASELSRSKADLVCPGVDDDQVIQAAINLMPALGVGGRVLLTEGTFRCRYGSIVASFAHAVTIQGVGVQSTRLVFAGGSGPGFDISFGSDIIRDMHIMGAGVGAGVRFHAGTGARAYNILFTNSGPGIDLDFSTSGAREVLIAGCLFYNGSYGIDATFGSSTGHRGRGVEVTNNHFESNGNSPIRLSHADGVIIADNYINLISPPLGTDAIEIVTNIQRLVVTGNILNVAAGAASGIAATGTAHEDWLIAGNFIDGEAYGIDLSNATIDGLMVSGNYVHSAGIRVDGGTITNGRLVGNNVHQPQNHGIHLNNQDDFVVSGNTVDLAGQATNTYDGILLTGTSSRNHIHANKVAPRGSSPTPRYGINVADAACTCNIVVGNVLGDSADYGTDALNDAGTDTQLFYPADATYGDNFTDCTPSSPTSP